MSGDGFALFYGPAQGGETRVMGEERWGVEYETDRSASRGSSSRRKSRTRGSERDGSLSGSLRTHSRVNGSLSSSDLRKWYQIRRNVVLLALVVAGCYQIVHFWRIEGALMRRMAVVTMGTKSSSEVRTQSPEASNLSAQQGEALALDHKSLSNDSHRSSAAVEKRSSEAENSVAQSIDGSGAGNATGLMDDQAGSPKGNFIDWFRKSKEDDESGKLRQIECPGGPHERLCEHVFRFLRKAKARVFVDVSCVKNTKWTPTVVNKISNEFFPFKYVCIDADEEKLRVAEAELATIESKLITFQHAKWYSRDGLSKPDPALNTLVLAFDVFSQLTYGRVHQFFIACKKAKFEAVVFDNFPKVSNDPSDRRYLNVKKHPFKFGQGDVVQNITDALPNEPERQLLMYNQTTLPITLSDNAR